jgi:hypothetical protein
MQMGILEIIRAVLAADSMAKLKIPSFIIVLGGDTLLHL